MTQDAASRKTVHLPDAVDHRRRRLVGLASALAVLAPFVSSRPARAQATARVDAGAAFKSPKRVEAGVLEIGYVEVGPQSGAPVILLHGWPYDIHSYAGVAPLLAAA